MTLPTSKIDPWVLKGIEAGNIEDKRNGSGIPKPFLGIVESKPNFMIVWTFRLIRWILILAFFAFVMRGWYLSFCKYYDEQTSISLIKNETDMYQYPSVTFCPKFKDRVGITDKILANQSGELDMTKLNASLKEWSWERRDFLTFFSHPEHGDPRKGTHILDQDQYWTETIPHSHESGKCFTYNPPFISHSGFWFGIRFGLKLPGDYGGLSDKDKIRLMKNSLRIYVHKKGYFTFYKQDNFPNSLLLDMSWIKYRHATSITMKYFICTVLDSPDRPCTNIPNYDFTKCVDLKLSERRGCQPPWNYHRDSVLPICTDLNRIRDYFGRGADGLSMDDYDRPEWSSRAMANLTGCKIPCENTGIKHKYSYDIIDDAHWLKPLEGADNSTDWTVHLWFKNFLFKYEAEYVVCNWTCLIGEVGGNLGFFLGGSILAFSDLLLRSVQDRFERRWN